MGSTGAGWGHFIFRVFHYQPLRAILIYLYEPETRILSAPKMNVATSFVIHVEYCHPVMCPISKGSSLRGFIGDIFDFANKEDQPRAGTRLRVLVKVKKIENR